MQPNRNISGCSRTREPAVREEFSSFSRAVGGLEEGRGRAVGLVLKNKMKTEPRAAPPNQPGLTYHMGYLMDIKVK